MSTIIVLYLTIGKHELTSWEHSSRNGERRRETLGTLSIAGRERSTLWFPLRQKFMGSWEHMILVPGTQHLEVGGGLVEPTRVRK